MMLRWCFEFARTQSREELARQFSASDRIEGRRRILSLMPFVFAALYLPLWICVVLGIADSITEIIGLRLLKKVDPPRQPGQYILCLALFAVSQAIYMTMATLIWQCPEEFAKAYAVGAYLINLVHLSTVRTVHFPLSIVSLSVATLMALLGNGYFWVAQGHWIGLGISTICIVCVTFFVVTTMTTVHELYQEMFRDRLAAEAANDAKSRFLAQMSHELRTPLNAILGMGYAEMTDTKTPESKERLTTMVQSARSLSVILDDILDMAAVQAGQLPIRPTVVNLRAETLATIALFRQQMADSNMKLAVSIADHLPDFALIDGQRYRQCLSNVLSNAVKYSQNGTVNISVSAPKAILLEVMISDSGPGVPDRLRERIFEPFHRGESIALGTGLGLSISRTLARRMGGDVVLFAGGTGARFLLSFALVPAMAPDTPLQPQLLADLTGRRVLVVDDIATNRLVAMTYLRIMGALPFEASDGAAALDLLRTDPPEIVLLDMLMPGMDGMATLNNIRALPGPVARVAVIAMTAGATEQRRNQYLSEGLDGYVSKPLSPEALGAAIAAVLPARSD
jgi:signal transduction histidine kinase/ActR/RegA family two-component response regulator